MREEEDEKETDEKKKIESRESPSFCYDNAGASISTRLIDLSSCDSTSKRVEKSRFATTTTKIIIFFFVPILRG